jgi:hypothetical protein
MILCILTVPQLVYHAKEIKSEIRVLEKYLSQTECVCKDNIGCQRNINRKGKLQLKTGASPSIFWVIKQVP